MSIGPATLEGSLVRLEPLAMEHLDDLVDAGLRQPGVFRWYIDPVSSPGEMRSWVEKALRRRTAGTDQPFAIIDRGSGRAIGSSRFMSIDRIHHRLEIGSTWLAPWLRGTGHNSEAKLLQLEHAFTTLGAIRVEFKTDSLNEGSRAALLAVGASYEGILRHHMIVSDGRHRHSAYYSIVAQEWPDIRTALLARIERQIGAQPTSTMV